MGVALEVGTLIEGAKAMTTTSEQLAACRARQAEHDAYLRNGIDVFMTPCAAHSGDNTPPFDEFVERYGRKCLQCVVDEAEVLREFAAYILAEFWEGPPDGDMIQDEAVRLGLLRGVTVTEPCGENCNCAEWDEFPMTCYRKTELVGASVPGKPWGGRGDTIETERERLRAENKRLREALEKIAALDYGDGSCWRGCYSPEIARDALVNKTGEPT